MSRIHLFLVCALLSTSCLSASAQHDACRDAVRLLAAGQYTKGLATLDQKKGRMNSPSGEAELEFVRSLAASLQKQPREALEHARLSLDNGLPFRRLQAGPRDALATVYGLPEYASLRAKRGEALLHGPMLGAVTDTSARLWLRTAEEAEVKVEVTPADEGGAVLRGTGRTKSQSDYTTVVELKPLQPNRRYRYQVYVNGKGVGDAETFRTYPRTGEAARFVVGFGGGAGYTPEHERNWETILGRKPLAFLMLGDNVYIDDPTHSLTQRYCYYRRQSRPEWRHLTAVTSMYAIYDDHDFGTNDCVPGPELESPPWKREVWNVFRQNWVNPSYGGGEKQPGCWFDFMIGNVHFIMLDCRYYRDRKGGSMLGPVQKTWLLETLKRSSGTFKILVSSVPWSPGVKPGSKDTWDGFSKEREEIFTFIRAQKVNGIVLLAADRHRSDLRRIPRPGAYPLYEAMSSRLTNYHTHALVENAKGSDFLFGYNETCSFGLLDFNTTAADPRLVYRIVTIDGKEVYSHRIMLSEISLQ